MMIFANGRDPRAQPTVRHHMVEKDLTYRTRLAREAIEMVSMAGMWATHGNNLSQTTHNYFSTNNGGNQRGNIGRLGYDKVALNAREEPIGRHKADENGQ